MRGSSEPVVHLHFVLCGVQEIRDIIHAYEAAVAAGRATALCTLVHLEGSSYRQPGARMLVDDTGVFTGAISGGCLEGDALRRAMLAISRRRPSLVTYDTSDEENTALGVQLGCAGIIRVLFEPIQPGVPENPISLLQQSVAYRHTCALVTCYDADDPAADHPGTCWAWSIEESPAGPGPAAPFKHQLIADIRQDLLARRSAFRQYPGPDGTLSTLIQILQPPVALLVGGAGNDAIPLVQLAGTLGWDVTVIDGRNTHARAERFAAACRVKHTRPEALLEGITLDDRTACIMLSHNYDFDRAMLSQLVHTDVVYVGMLGPRRKLDRMLADLESAGVDISNHMRARIHGPAGLDIGAETPAEIALSIIAEIQAVIHVRDGGKLKHRPGSIHPRAGDGVTGLTFEP